MKVVLVYLESFWTRADGGEDRYRCVRLSADGALGIGCLRAFAEADPELSGQVEIRTVLIPDGGTDAEAAAEVLRRAPDLVGFTCTLWNSERIRRVCAALGSRKKKPLVVLGGPDIPRESAALSALLAGSPAADFAVRGEGEIAFRDLLRALLRRRAPVSVPGLAYREGGRVVVGPPAEPVSALGSIPGPYAAGALSIRPGALGMLTLETARGCPFRCSYCDYHAGRHRVRRFPLDRLRQDLEAVRRSGFQGCIYLTDPSLNAARDRGAAVFRLLRDLPNPVHLELTPGDFTPGSIRAIAAMAAPSLAIGIQSTEPAALAAVGRPCDLRRSARNIAALLSHPNVSVELELLLGLPGDSYASFCGSVDWVLSFSPRRPHLTVFDLVLLPNSPLASHRGDFGLEADASGLVTGCRSFPERDLARASWLVAAYSHLRSDPERWSAFERAAASSSRPPSALLEGEVRRLRAEGRIPGIRVVGQGGRRLADWAPRVRRWIESRASGEDVGTYPRWW